MAENKHGTENQITDELNLGEILRYLYTYRLILCIFIIVVPCMILAWSALFHTSLYRSTAVMQIVDDEGVSMGTSRPPGFSDEKQISKKMFALESFFESRHFRLLLLDEVYGRSHLTDGYENIDKVKNDLRGDLKALLQDSNRPSMELANWLHIAPEKEHDGMLISATTAQPTVAKNLAILASRLLMAVNFNKNLSQVRNIKAFLERQTESTRQHLAELESQIMDLQLTEKAYSLEEVSSLIDKEQVELRLKHRTLKNQYKANEDLISEYREEQQQYVKQLQKGAPSYLYLMQLQKKIELLQYQAQVNNSGRKIASDTINKGELGTLLEDFGSVMNKTQAEFSTSNPWEYLQLLEKNMSDLQLKQKNLKSELDAATHTLKSQGDEFGRIPEKIFKLVVLRRNIEMTQRLYGELEAKLQETRVREAGQKNSLQVVIEPEQPISAEGLGLFARLWVAIIIGTLFGFGILMVRYILLPTVRGKKDLVNSNLVCIGEVPQISNHAALSVKPENLLVLESNGGGLEATAFRNLRFRIEKLLNDFGSDERGKVVSLLGLNGNEGKSFVTANLASSLSLIGRRVLVIDLDYNKREVKNYFANAQTVTDVVENPIGLGIKFEQTRVNDRLDILTSEPATTNLCEQLERESFTAFMKDLKSKYDVILVDTPPMKTHFEAVIASRFSQLMVMIANQRRTLREDVIRSARDLKEVFPHPIHLILNYAYDEIL